MAREQRDPREGERDPRDPRQLGDPMDARDRRVLPRDPRDERQPGDPRDTRTLIDATDGLLGRSMPAAIVAWAYMVIGLGLWFQPGRWNRTPAYGILLDIFSQRVWGTLYVAAAIGLAISVWLATNRAFAIIAHITAIALTTVWLTAFIVRYLTDQSTTVVNPVTWTVLLGALVYSALLVDKHKVVDQLPHPPPAQPPDPAQ
jgi:hypothetical protein